MSQYLMRVAVVAVATGVFGVGPAAAADWPWSKKAAAPEKPGFGERLGNAYDLCWPQRYSAVARQEVLAPFAQQALNGHVINQTIWNYHFEPGTDRLTPAGVEKLDSLVRVRPGPDTKVYIQTARDLAANVDTVDQLHASRADLDLKRANMIGKFLAAQPQQLPFEVYVHDPAETGISSTAAGNAYRGQMQGYRGGITGGAGVQTGAGGGSAPGGGGSGAPSGGTGPTR